MHFLCQKRSLEGVAIVLERQRIAFVEAIESDSVSRVLDLYFRDSISAALIIDQAETCDLSWFTGLDTCPT